MENNFEDEKSLKSQSQTRYSNNTNKKFSILPDLATGWRPKSLAIPPPILVKYKENYITKLINNQPKFNYKLLYLGPRHYNSFSFHNQVLHQYNVRFGLKNQQLPDHFQKEIEKYKLLDNRQFSGMNPKLKNKSSIQFDSNFQSGNLDLVIQINQNQYDLFLRPDTNTCGHTQWFYFKVNFKKNPQNQNKIVKLNICNNKKMKTLYCKGMKPYVLSRKMQQQKNIGWHQKGRNVTYNKYVSRYSFQTHHSNGTEEIERQNQKKQRTIIQNQKQNQPNLVNKQQQQNYFCLSFQYEVEYDEDEVYFAYCPPYTYSQLRKQIANLKKRAASQENCQINQQKLCISLSGVQVPIITITDSSVQDQNKKILISTARIHPGQSNGSYVMEGFLNFLVSHEAQNIRKTCIFKVIPMINPDGVILGNFRTGLAGKDLNRQFKVKNLQLLPQIASLKQYIRKLKFERGSSLIYYLDFHGHSTKKNVFVYGPEYQTWDLKFERSKILPRLISFKTNMFKLNSCLYKIANYKKATARAFMLGHIPYCYTVESSIGIYKQKNGQDCNFTVQKWKQMGKAIGQVFQKCLDKLKQQTFNLVRKQKKKKKSIFVKNSTNELSNTEQNAQINDNSSCAKVLQNSLNLIDLQNSTKQKKQNIQRETLKSISLKSIQNSKNLFEPIRHIKRRQKQVTLVFPKIKQQKNESDQEGQNDGKSDCESQNNDFTKSQYELLSKDIIKVIEDFKKVIEYQQNSKKVNLSLDKKKLKKKGSQTNHLKSIVQKTNQKGKISKKQIIQMKLVPSLKHKLLNFNNLTIFDKNLQRQSQKPKKNLSEPKIPKTKNINVRNHPSLLLIKQI